MMPTPELAICFGTVNRLEPLKACISSIRRAAGSLTFVCLVADGNSTDGSREWLAAQPDCELLEGGLDGAVKAFNVAFARAMELQCPWVAQFNDDLTFADGLELERAVAIMRADDSIGAVAFASDRYSPGKPSCEWMRFHDKCYANQGVFRREAGMAAARFLGDPEGKRWWNPVHHTYASDTELGLAIWRLGWTIHEAVDLCVRDTFMSDGGHEEPLRKKNYDAYTTADEFLERWGDPRSSEYNRADAERFGGRLL